MWLFKIAGGSLIIFSCTLIGFHLGKKFSDRYQNLKHLEQCIKILETEIVYGAVPLPDALMNVYRKGNKTISFIFKDINSHLLENRDGDIFSSFLNLVDVLKAKLNFKEEDIELFLSLGRMIGSSDRQDQEKNFKLILKQIAVNQGEAKLQRDKNERMYKNLGVLTGVAIIIILL